MSSSFNKIAKDFANTLRNTNTKKPTPYDTQAEVRRVDGDTAWVHIPGGVDETPVQLTTSAKKGDVVQVRVSGGRAWLYGNATSPPTDDTKADEVDKKTAVAVEYVGELNSRNVTAESINAATGYIDDLYSKNITTENLKATTGYIQDLTSENITAGDITADHATVGSLDANYAKIDMANVNNAWIENGAIKKAEVFDENVFDLSGNRATLSRIDASKINVANLRADNLIVRRINGQPVVGGYTLISNTSPGYDTKNPQALGWYEFVNGQWVLSTDTEVDSVKAYYQEGDEVSLYDQAYIDGLENDLQQQIDGAVETFTGSVVPTLVNYPYNEWYDTSVTPVHDERAKHVGDIYYVVNSAADENGYCYRFAYDNTTHAYSWVLIKDSDITKALSDISELQTFESETTSWIDETDQGLETIRTNHTALSGRVDAVKATADAALPAETFESFESTTFTDLVDEVDEQSTTMTNMTTRLGLNADGTQSATDIVSKESELEQTVNGISTRVGKTEAHLIGMYATSSTAAGTAAKVATITPSIPSGTNWELGTGTTITVKFTNANTAASPTLNVNGKGAKAIKTYANGNLTAAEYKWAAGSTFTFTYNGTNWLMQDSTASVRMTSNETQINQTATSIESLATGNTTYTKPDGTTGTSAIGTTVSQTANNVLIKATKTDTTAAQGGRHLIQSLINVAPDGVTIDADKVNITGTTIFNKVNADADAKAAMLNSEIEIGGTNMLIDSDAPTLTKIAATANRYFMNENKDSAGSIVAGSNLPQRGLSNVVKFTVPADRNNTNYAIAMYSGGAYIPVIEGQQYTLSYYARKTSGTANVWFEMGVSPYVSYSGSALTTSWQRYSHTFTYTNSAMAGSGYTRAYFGTTSKSASACVVEMCGFKMEKGNKASDWTPAPEDTDFAISDVKTTATAAYNRKSAYTGIGRRTDGDLSSTISGFSLVTGAVVSIYFGSSCNYTGALTLNVSSTGAKPVWVGDLVTSDTNRLMWHWGTTLTFGYDGTNWRLLDTPPTYYGTSCSTTASTPAKATTIPSGMIFKGTVLEVPMTNANTASAPSLSINNTASNAISLPGNILYGTGPTAPTEENGYSWLAGMSVIFKYDGKYWRTGNQTIIDGGHILTGTINADRIKANVIEAVNGGTGKIDADKINVGQINIGDLSGNIGGENLLQQFLIINNPTSYCCYRIPLTENLIAGETYTLQLWGITFNNTPAGGTVMAYWGGGSNNLTGDLTPDANGYVVKTFTVTQAMADRVPDGGKWFLNIYNSGPSSAKTARNMTLERWKLEKGNKATSWSLSSADTRGGINLLRCTADMNTGSGGWSAGKFRYSGNTGGAISHVTATNPHPDGINGAIRVTNSATSALTLGFCQDSVPDLKTNKLYTLSGWVRASAAGLTINFQPIYVASAQSTGVKSVGLTDTSWSYYSVTLRLKGDQATTYSAGYIYVNNVPSNGWFEVMGLKLEEGAIATGWRKGQEADVSNFVTQIDNSGIFISPSNQSPTELAPGNSVKINGDGMEVFNVGDSVAFYGTTSRIGKEGASHIEMDYHSLQLKDSDSPSHTYFWVSDLRDENNEYGYTEELTGTGYTTRFSLSYRAKRDKELSVTVSDGSGGEAYLDPSNAYWLRFETAPTDGSTITVSYITDSYFAKAYTLGIRKNNSDIGPLSTCFGLNNIASGDQSFAEGWDTEATGAGSHSEGYGTKANGNYSHAQGYKTIANRAYQVAIGKFNEIDNYNISFGTRGKYAFIVGNGIDGDNRSNALTVDWNGNVEAAGEVHGTLSNPTISITAFTGTLRSATVYKQGNVVQLLVSVQKTSATASGKNVFEGTINTTALRPKMITSSGTYYGSYALNAIITSAGEITVRNSDSRQFAAMTANCNISFTYLVD